MPMNLSDDLDISQSQLNEPSVDFLLLADRAEAVNGKLYMLGGAWDRMFVEDIKLRSVISVAIGILVPWNATNKMHTASIAVVDTDGQPAGFSAELQFSQGRPPWITGVETQRIVLALPAVPIVFPRFGDYVVKAYINGMHQKDVSFKILPVPGTSASE